MLIELMKLILATWGVQGSIEVGVGYRFSAIGDPQNPVAYAACLHRDMDDRRDVIVAHRTLPCGTRVHLVNLRNGRSVTAVVGDRGPYGKKRDGTWRGVVDMSPRVDRALRGKGKAWVALLTQTTSYR